MTRWRAALAIALVAAAMVAVLPAVGDAPRAEAHSVLVRSSPSPQDQLARAPAAIDLWFSEPLEPAFSTFELYASDGTQLAVDGIRLDPADDTHLSGLTRSLGPGIYTVVYRTLSTRDGHDWSGAYTFTVLNEDGSVPSGGGFAPSTGSGNSPAQILGRWFSFAGLAVAVGAGLIALLASIRAPSEGTRAASAIDPRSRFQGLPATVRQRFVEILTSPRAAPDQERLAAGARALHRRLAIATLPMIVGGSALLVLDRQDTLGGSVGDILGDSRFGTLLLWRALAVLALLVAIALGALAARQRSRAEIALAGASTIAGVGALYTMSLLSHAAAAPGERWAVLIDLVHLVLAALWVGGLIALGALFVGRRRDDRSLHPLAGLVGRFSFVAAASLYLLMFTGTLRALGEIPSISALTETGYGRWLLVKLALIAPLLLVALLNRHLLARWTEAHLDAATAARRMRRLLPMEGLLAVVVLASVAVLGQVPTARGEAAPTTSAIVIPYNRIEVVDDLTIHLQVTPAAVGQNELRAHIYRADGSDPGEISSVRMTVSRAAAQGGDELEGAPQGDNIYTATATFSGITLRWDVTVDVRRPGFDDARAAFAVPVESTSGSAGGHGFGSIAPQLTTNFLWAVILVGAGLGIVLWQRRNRAAAGTYLRLGGVLAIFVALFLAVSGEQHTHGGQLLVNPNPGDPASIERGRVLYATNCVGCHGTEGHGDGPGAAALFPPPADLTLHVPLHPEGDTYTFIAFGLPGTAMPAWNQQLDDQQIWDLVNFLRSEFAPDGTTSSGG